MSSNHTPTLAGTRLLASAVRVLDELDGALWELAGEQLAAAPVRLGAFATAAAGLVPKGAGFAAAGALGCRAMAKRTEIGAEIRIAASAQSIWDVIGATERYAEWVVNTLAVTRVDAAVADEGVSYDEHNRIIGPWTARSTWRVLSSDPPRRTVHAGSGIPLAQDLELECTLTPGGEDTLYRHVISYRPALGQVGGLIDRVVAPSLRRDIRATVAKLKALVEAELGVTSLS